jgi:hypothetical protein
MREKNSDFFSVSLCSCGGGAARTMSTTTEQPPKTTPAKKRKGAGRKPGRPYRRLADDVLGVRRDTLDKKLQVLVARTTLLEDRLKAYEQEVAARAEEGQAA